MSYRAHALSDVELLLDGLRLFEPERWRELLGAYYALLGDAIADAGHAIERADAGAKPHGYALADDDFRRAYAVALHEVRAERRRRDARRAEYDRSAAGLLAESRLRDVEVAA